MVNRGLVFHGAVYCQVVDLGLSKACPLLIETLKYLCVVSHAV